jgi:hypothetical protein
MFTLEQQIFIVQCFLSNGERFGPIRHLQFLRNFNKSFRTFKALNQQLPLKVYKCVNMFLETVSAKKGSRRPTKRSAENIEEGEQRVIAEINLRN